MHGLGLSRQKHWQEYCRSGKKPTNIPTQPNIVYKDSGWKGYGDWLGTGRSSNRYKVFRPFEEAREFARSLGINSGEQWHQYSRSGQRPEDIPSNPNNVYEDSGWRSWGDWLGTGSTPQPGTERWRPFEEARAFVHTLGLEGRRAWTEYANSTDKPTDIPAVPWTVYRESWQNLGDWLGTGFVATREREYRPFEEAREFVRSLGLKSAREWREYSKSGEKPADIPGDPQKVYGDKWKGR